MFSRLNKIFGHIVGSRGQSRPVINPTALIELQIEIVICARQGIEIASWDSAVVDFEIDRINGELKSNCVCLVLKKSGENWSREDFCLPLECYKLFFQLRERYAPEIWKTCRLEFDSQGEYAFEFSYETAKRLSNNRNPETSLQTFVPKRFR